MSNVQIAKEKILRKKSHPLQCKAREALDRHTLVPMQGPAQLEALEASKVVDRWSIKRITETRKKLSSFCFFISFVSENFLCQSSL